MSTMGVTWIRFGQGFPYDGSGTNIIGEVISRETVTTSGISAQSGVAPDLANGAIVHAVDANLLVTKGDNPTASPTEGVPVLLGEKEAFGLIVTGATKIAGIEL